MRKLLCWLSQAPPDYCCECANYMPDTHWLKWTEDMERMDLKENYKQCAIKFARCAAMVEHRSKHGEEFLCYPEKPLSLYDYTHCSIVRGLHQNIEKWCKYYKEK